MPTEVGSAYITVGGKADKSLKESIEKSMPDGAKKGALFGKAFASGAKSQISGFANWLKTGAVMGAVSAVSNKIMSTVSASMDSAIARADILNSFPKVMTAAGYGVGQIDTALTGMLEAVDGMPTRLQDMVSNVQFLASAMGNLSDGQVNAVTIGRAFNDMMLAGGKDAMYIQLAFDQFNKTVATGKVEMDAWKTIFETSPAAINKVAESMLGAGKGGMDLMTALQKGTVKMPDFLAQIVKMDNEGSAGFASFREQATAATKGIATSMNNCRNAVSNNVAKILEDLNKNGEIAGIFDSIKSNINNFGNFLKSSLATIKEKIDYEGFKNAFNSISEAVANAFGGSASMTPQQFGDKVATVINALIPVLNALKPPIEVVACAFAFITQNAGTVIPILVALFIITTLLKGAFAIAGVINTFGDALGKIGTKGVIAKAGEEAAGKGAATAAPHLLKMGLAVLAVGAGIALACAGILMLAFAATMLASSGIGAVLVFVLMVGAIAALAAVFAVLGEALTIGSVGILAFGAAILMIGVGVFLACAGVALFASQLPTIAAYGFQAAAAIFALVPSLLMLGVAALVAGIGVGIFGIALLIAAPGLIIAAAAALVFGVAMLMIGIGAMMAGLGLMMMAQALPLIAENAAPAALGIGELGVACGIAAIPIGAATIPIGALAAAIVPMGTAAMMAAMGIMMMAAFLPVIASEGQPAGDGMRAFADGAKEAAPSILEAAPAFAIIAAAASAMASGMSSAASSLSFMVSSAGASGAAVTTLDVAMQHAAATATSVFSSIGDNVSNAASRVQQACAVIRTAMASLSNKTVKLSVESGSVKLPHFNMRGSFDARTGAVPQVDVSWYKKGAIFTRPTVFAGVGEAGNEAALPLYGRYMRPFAHAVADEMGGSSTTNYNFQMSYDASQDARDMFRDIARQVRRFEAMRG